MSFCIAFIAGLLGIIFSVYLTTGICLADDGGGLNNLILVDNINIDTNSGGGAILEENKKNFEVDDLEVENSNSNSN